jgi:hypothetical protein
VKKNIVVRGLGPSLQDKGVSDFLPDPVLELHAANGSLITTNDNWKDNPVQAALIQAAGLPPDNDLESAIFIRFAPSSYTAIVRGKGAATGVGLVEMYDVESMALAGFANISTRGFVRAGENVMIGGFTLGRKTEPAEVVLRALGPSLAERGISNPLADPTLELHNAHGDKIGFNDNWQDDAAQAEQITADGLAPLHASESALAATLPRGRYTVIVAGKNGATGVALVEIYRLP